MNSKFTILFLLLSTVLFLACNTQKGYSDLDELYSDFVKHLKESDEESLNNFCHKITPDEGTAKYMKDNNFSYRGFPEELKKQNVSPSEIGDEYFKAVRRFRQKLRNKRKLNNLKYIGREREGEYLFDERLDIYVTETFILMESNGDTIRCKLGEMFRINGKWKSFTTPYL